MRDPAAASRKLAPKRPARRPAAAPSTRPTPRRPRSAKKPTAEPTVTAEPVKVKKPKLVRDSFTLPKDEYAALAELKQRCAKLERPCKKSELLRAGIKALTALSDKSLLAALKAVPALKTGRPKKT